METCNTHVSTLLHYHHHHQSLSHPHVWQFCRYTIYMYQYMYHLKVAFSTPVVDQCQLLPWTLILTPQKTTKKLWNFLNCPNWCQNGFIFLKQFMFLKWVWRGWLWWTNKPFFKAHRVIFIITMTMILTITIISIIYRSSSPSSSSTSSSLSSSSLSSPLYIIIIIVVSPWVDTCITHVSASLPPSALAAAPAASLSPPKCLSRCLDLFVGRLCFLFAELWQDLLTLWCFIKGRRQRNPLFLWDFHTIQHQFVCVVFQISQNELQFLCVCVSVCVCLIISCLVSFPINCHWPGSGQRSDSDNEVTEANNQQHNSNTIVEDPAWLICSSISRCADDWERVSLESDDRPILSWLSSVDTYIRYLAGYRPIIRGTPGASNFRLISLANTETLLSPSFMLVKYGSIWNFIFLQLGNL